MQPKPDDSRRAVSSRRDVLTGLACGAIAAFGPSGASRAATSTAEAQPDDDSPDARSPDALTPDDIRSAEKVVGVEYTDDERAQILRAIEDQLDVAHDRLAFGELPNALAPALTFNPLLPGAVPGVTRQDIVRSRANAPLPPNEDDIAFAPVTQLSRWIESRAITSEQLTRIYLDRLERFGPRLECVVTLTPELALAQARRADDEFARGISRGPLHGIPYGAKDLLDTANIRTTWGATPFKDRVPGADAPVITRLERAGAVLVAKLTLGALAYGDIWFDGRTRNPWNAEQGSSGSSAGSAAATTAGLVGFSIGTETWGSIVSPCLRCGATGLRPTFGRVPRTGAMALCWSLDKIGPICRAVEDTILVLDAINGADDGDPSSVSQPIEFRAGADVRGIRLGYVPAWFEDGYGATAGPRALEAARAIGVTPVELELPDLPLSCLQNILLCETAAAFEHLTRSNQDDEMVWQDDRAWPNTFRRTWFVPGPELVQAQRIRREAMRMMAGIFDDVDVILDPTPGGGLCLTTNNTGHPSLTIRAAFDDEDGTPRGVNLLGRLYEDGRLCEIGMAFERELDVWSSRPPLAD